jgi:protein-tyrosine phosphatase
MRRKRVPAQGRQRLHRQLRIAFTDIDLGQSASKLTVAVWVRNLLDEQHMFYKALSQHGGHQRLLQRSAPMVSKPTSSSDPEDSMPERTVMKHKTIKLAMLAVAWWRVGAMSPAAAATRHVARLQHSRVAAAARRAQFPRSGRISGSRRAPCMGDALPLGLDAWADACGLHRAGGRGIRVVCDFRDSKERAAEPVAWRRAARAGGRLCARHGRADASGQTPGWTAEQTSAAMTASYPRMLTQFNGQYRRMFAELLAGHAPLAFNCSAGKDRTGMAAALLLTARGARHGDRGLSADQPDAAYRRRHGRQPGLGQFSAQLPPAIAHPFMIADRRYIEAALAVVDSHKDGASGYLRDELGLAPTDLARLRHLYLN